MKKNSFLSFTLAVLAAVLLTFSSTVPAKASSLDGAPNYTVNYSGTEEPSGYLFPESSDFKFQGFSPEHEAWVYQYGVNEIYARHGYTFQTPEVAALFSSKSWYTPDSGFNESVLSETEKYNIDFLSQCMAATGQDGGYGIPSGNQAQPPASSDVELNEEGQKIKDQLKTIQLPHSYTTRFGTVNQITYPAFTFDYPDGWTITQEEVTPSLETVTLTSPNGAEITYSAIMSEDISSGSAVNMSKVSVSPIAESSFIPGYVQGSDLSSLGKFAVAELKTTAVIDMKNDSDFTEVDGPVSYGVLPVSQMGDRDSVRRPYIAEFSFEYSGHIAFIASAPVDKDFDEKEKLEAIAVLSSFRAE